MSVMVFISAAPGTDSGSGTFLAVSWLHLVHCAEQSLVPPVGSPARSPTAAAAAGAQPQSRGHSERG